MKYRYLYLVPFLCLGACSVVNEGPNRRIDNVDAKLGTVEEKVDALIAYNNKTYDILVDNELRIAELEKDARKRGVPTPQKGPDITSLPQQYHQRIVLTPPDAGNQARNEKVLPQENAQVVQKRAEVGALTGQNLSAAEETTQQAVQENVVEAPKQQVQQQPVQQAQQPVQTQTQVATAPAQNTQAVAPVVTQQQKTQAPQVQQQKVQQTPKVQQAQQNVAPTQVAQVQKPATQPVQQQKMSSSDMYNHAYNLYQSHNYAKAEKAFDEFLAQYPNDVLAPNALYWKGETLYARGIYPQAIFAFKEVQSRFPTHPKTADSLLKTAMSYARLGDSENASLHYLVLVEDWAGSDAARKARNMGAVQ